MRSVEHSPVFGARRSVRVLLVIAILTVGGGALAQVIGPPHAHVPGPQDNPNTAPDALAR